MPAQDYQTAAPPNSAQYLDRSAISDTVTPDGIVNDVAIDAKKKAKLDAGQILTRSFLCTPFLAYAVALVALLISQGVPSAIAGLLFPAGYIMLSVLGLEMNGDGQLLRHADRLAPGAHRLA